MSFRILDRSTTTPSRCVWPSNKPPAVFAHSKAPRVEIIYREAQSHCPRAARLIKARIYLKESPACLATQVFGTGAVTFLLER